MAAWAQRFWPDNSYLSHNTMLLLMLPKGLYITPHKLKHLDIWLIKARTRHFLDLDQPRRALLLFASSFDTVLQFRVYRIGTCKTESDMDYNKYHVLRPGTYTPSTSMARRGTGSQYREAPDRLRPGAYTPSNSMARGGTGSQYREAPDGFIPLNARQLQRARDQQRSVNSSSRNSQSGAVHGDERDARTCSESLELPEKYRPKEVPLSLTGGGNPSKPGVLCSVSTNRRLQLTMV